jgi:hypothetical protein
VYVTIQFDRITLAARTYNHKKVLILNAYSFLFLCQVNSNCSTALHGLHYPNPHKVTSYVQHIQYVLKKKNRAISPIFYPIFIGFL